MPKLVIGAQQSRRKSSSFHLAGIQRSLARRNEKTRLNLGGQTIVDRRDHNLVGKMLASRRCKSAQVRPAQPCWASLVQLGVVLALGLQVGHSSGSTDDVIFGNLQVHSAQLRDRDRQAALLNSDSADQLQLQIAPFDPSGFRNIREAIQSHPELRLVSLAVNLLTFACEPG